MEGMIMKKLLTVVLAICVMLSLNACGEAESANWQGTFYMETDEYNTYIFDITSAGEQGFEFTFITTNTYGGGTASTSVTGAANILKGSTAESSSGYQFSLSGDTLTVKVPEPDEYTPDYYAGDYTRGDPLPSDDESAEAESEGPAESDSAEEGIGGGSETADYDLSGIYYVYMGEEATGAQLVINSDGTAEITDTDGYVSTGEWAVEDTNILNITSEGETMSLMISDENTLYYGADHIFYKSGTEPEQEIDTDGGEPAIGGIVMQSYYFWNGDHEQDCFYFYPDGTAEYHDAPADGGDSDETESFIYADGGADGAEIFIYTYTVDGDLLILSDESGYESVYSIEDGGATLIGEEGEAFYLNE